MFCSVSRKYQYGGLSKSNEGPTFILDDKLGDAKRSISSHLHRSKSSIGETKLSQLPCSISRRVVA